MRYFLFLLLLGQFAPAQTPQEHFLYFDSNAYLLTETQKSEIISLFSSEENTITIITVHGFCDDVGTEKANLILSQKRAAEVADFLRKELQVKVSNSIGEGEIPLPENAVNSDDIRRNNRMVKITYSKEPIAATTDPAETKKPSVEYKTFSDELKKGDRILMKNLLFLGSLTLFKSPEEAEEELRKVINYMNSHPDTKIEIQGHVCCITNSFKDAYDRISQKNNLSQTRAKKVFDYLVEQGISPQRMNYQGYGRRFPIPGGEEHDNKRVEILILED